MVRGTKSLPIGLIPKQDLVATVRYLVVNDGGNRHDGVQILAHQTQRMGTQKRVNLAEQDDKIK